MPVLPHGPWKKVASAQWDKYPLTIYQNEKKVLLFTLFEKKEDVVSGVLILERMPFILEGDVSKLVRLHKGEMLIIDKIKADKGTKYVVIDSTPKLVGYSEEELAREIGRQYTELEAQGKLLVKTMESLGGTLKPLHEATEEEVQSLMADPLSLLTLAKTGGLVKQKDSGFSQVMLGINREKAQVTSFLKSTQLTSVIGEGEEKRLHAMHVVIENILLNNMPVMVFDSEGSFASMALPNNEEEDFAAYGGNSPMGFPFKPFKLGESLFVDLKYITAELFLSTFGLEKSDVTALLKKTYDENKGKIAVIDDLILALKSVKESKQFTKYLIGKSIRTMEVARKSNPTLFGQNVSTELQKPWKDGIGKLFHVNTAGLREEVKQLVVYSLLEEISETPASEYSMMIAFRQDAATLKTDIVKKINQLKKQGIGFLLHSEHELEVQKFGSMTMVIELLANEAFVSEAGVEKKRRFTIRPAYSKCAEHTVHPPSEEAKISVPPSNLKPLPKEVLTEVKSPEEMRPSKPSIPVPRPPKR